MDGLTATICFSVPLDDVACAAFVQHHQPRLLRIAVRIIGNYEDAEEVAQDAMLKIVQSLPTIRRTESLIPWMSVIVTRACLSFVRKRQRERFRMYPLTVDLPTEFVIDDALLAREERAVVAWGLLRLRSDERAILVLRDVEDLPYSTICAVLQVSESCAKMRVQRARLALRDLLTPYIFMDSSAEETLV